MKDNERNLYKLYNRFMASMFIDLDNTGHEFHDIYCHDMQYILLYLVENTYKDTKIHQLANKCLNKVDLANSKYAEYYNVREDGNSDWTDGLAMVAELLENNENNSCYYYENEDDDMVVLEMKNKITKFLGNAFVEISNTITRFEAIKEFAEGAVVDNEFLNMKGRPHSLEEFYNLQIICDTRIRKVKLINSLVNAILEDNLSKDGKFLASSFRSYVNTVEKLDALLEIQHAE